LYSLYLGGENCQSRKLERNATWASATPLSLASVRLAHDIRLHLGVHIEAARALSAPEMSGGKMCKTAE